MNTIAQQKSLWIWPHVGATPISQGLDSEMFDRTDYNQHRPHSALGNIPPAEFAMKTKLEKLAA